MWFFSRRKDNLEKLETKVAELEDKLSKQYDEYDAMNESLREICKELHDFLIEENTNDIQQEQNSSEVVGEDGEIRTED